MLVVVSFLFKIKKHQKVKMVSKGQKLKPTLIINSE